MSRKRHPEVGREGRLTAAGQVRKQKPCFLVCEIGEADPLDVLILAMISQLQHLGNIVYTEVSRERTPPLARFWAAVSNLVHFSNAAKGRMWTSRGRAWFVATRTRRQRHMSSLILKLVNGIPFILSRRQVGDAHTLLIVASQERSRRNSIWVTVYTWCELETLRVLVGVSLLVVLGVTTALTRGSPVPSTVKSTRA